MTAIRITGMASGLPPNIVEQLMDAERIPIKQMEIKKNHDEEKFKLVSDLETKILEISKTLSELTNTRGFNFNKLISGDPNIVWGVVDPQNAVTGNWQIEVMQLAQKPGAVTNGFPDKDKTQIGVGYIKFETPDGVKEVYIGKDQSTLLGVADSINKAGLGLRATVINDRKERDAPFRLLVTGLKTGDEQQIVFPTVYMLDGDQDVYFDRSKPAQNARIKVDGFEMEVPENTVKDIIPGVDLELKQAAPGREISLSVKEDSEVITGKIKSFVETYNAALAFIQNQHKLQKNKEGRDALGPLGGDGLLRTIENNLRRLIIEPQLGVSGNIKRMNEIGIEFNRNGTLDFNVEKFNKSVSSDSFGVASYLQGDGATLGFVPALKREVKNLTNSSFGPLYIRKRGIEDKIKQANERIEDKEKQLVKKEEQLRKKFANLETTMSKMQTQMASLGGGQVGPKVG